MWPWKARLLELGCGSGRDAAYMLDNGFDVIASDAVQDMLDAAAVCHPALAGRICRCLAQLPGRDTQKIN